MTNTTLDISEARKQFNSLDERLTEVPVIRVMRHGKEAFAVVNMEFLRTVLETMDILSDPNAFDMLKQSLDDIREGRVFDHDDIEQELG